jgi:hypothetical protein
VLLRERHVDDRLRRILQRAVTAAAHGPHDAQRLAIEVEQVMPDVRRAEVSGEEGGSRRRQCRWGRRRCRGE